MIKRQGGAILPHDQVEAVLALTGPDEEKGEAMRRKIMLALAAISAAVLALPTTASALEPLHLAPTPTGSLKFDGNGSAIVSMSSGSTIGCPEVAGSAAFNPGGTTGTITLTFGCTLFGGKCNLTTTTLPFHLVTLPGKTPGVLITTNNGHFGPFTCLFMGELKGNGLIGAITFPNCAQVSTQMTIDFNATAHGVQEHTKVGGTETAYTLTRLSETVALSAHGTLTFPQQTQLVCT